MQIDSYTASKTISRFLKDRFDVGLVLGPFGSGKSVGCIMKLLKHALDQKPVMYQGRKTRLCKTIVVRNTYQELEDTTMETWDEWLPFELGKYNVQKRRLDYFWETSKGEFLQWQILFRSLDRPKDIRKLKSLEVTNGWINEAKEVALPVMTTIKGRLGRYPPAKIVEAKDPLLIMDSNLYDDDHYLYRLFEEEKPDTWAIYKQPSGLSPEAENTENLPRNYYKNMCQGQTQNWIDLFVHAKYVHLTDGRPVYPEFAENVHIAEVDYDPEPGYTIYLGFDWGLTPACVIAQQVGGQWRVLDEIVCFDTSAGELGQLVSELMNREYQGLTAVMTGDPANPRSQSDKMTPILMLNSKYGLNVSPASSNDPMLRRNAVAEMMKSLLPTGDPAFVINKRCKMYIKGLRGGYTYRRLQVVNEERYQDVPDKGSKFSHVCDAGEYAALGAGKGVALISGNKSDWSKKINTRRENRG